jgi:hypothetical protein
MYTSRSFTPLMTWGRREEKGRRGKRYKERRTVQRWSGRRKRVGWDGVCVYEVWYRGVSLWVWATHSSSSIVTSNVKKIMQQSKRYYDEVIDTIRVRNTRPVPDAAVTVSMSHPQSLSHPQSQSVSQSVASLSQSGFECVTVIRCSTVQNSTVQYSTRRQLLVQQNCPASFGIIVRNRSKVSLSNPRLPHGKRKFYH